MSAKQFTTTLRTTISTPIVDFLNELNAKQTESLKKFIEAQKALTKKLPKDVKSSDEHTAFASSLKELELVLKQKNTTTVKGLIDTAITSIDLSDVKFPKKKVAKRENQPKKPITAFFRFLNSNRDSIKASNPTVSMTDIGKIASIQWKALSDAARKPYEDAHTAEKAEYDVKMAELDAHDEAEAEAEAEAVPEPVVVPEPEPVVAETPKKVSKVKKTKEVKEETPALVVAAAAPAPEVPAPAPEVAPVADTKAKKILSKSKKVVA